MYCRVSVCVSHYIEFDPFSEFEEFSSVQFREGSHAECIFSRQLVQHNGPCGAEGLLCVCVQCDA